MITKNLDFISKYNFRPLILPFDEIQKMREALNICNDELPKYEGKLVIYPVLLKNKGVSEQILTLRYILYRKEKKENDFTPIRFDFECVLGNIKEYPDKFNNALFPNIIIPHKKNDSISLSQLFEINKGEFWFFFIEKGECGNIWIHNLKSIFSPIGGLCVGANCPKN